MTPDWLAQLHETQQRLFVFLEKLESRMDELTEAAVPELQLLKIEDEREFGNMFNGVRGQLDSVREKALRTYEEKVEDLYDQISDRINVLHPHYDKLRDFRTGCSDRFHNVFDEHYQKNIQRLEQAQFTDYEDLYRQILDEHEHIKNRFRCQQCGDTIPLMKIYFVTTHLTCPSCQTKNTFTPSTLASQLEHISRSLAEQRTRDLLDKHDREQERERDLYHQAHQLKLKKSPLKSTQENEQLQQQIDELERLRQESIVLAPQYYQQYQREMFDEWKRLVPDLAEHNERFYQSLNRRKI